MIVEMAGRPAEHLTATLEKHIGILNGIKDVNVHSIKVSEPREIETETESGEEKMWTVFAEADFECESFARLSETMFDFMPSSVEVIEPSKLTLEITEVTDLLNNISGRMHRYDEIAKVLGEKYKQMEAQIQVAQKILTERDAEIVELKKGKGKENLELRTQDSDGKGKVVGKVEKKIKKVKKKEIKKNRKKVVKK